MLTSNLGVDNEKEIKEKLGLILVAAKGKVRGYRDELNERFTNPGKVEKTQIPGLRAMRFIEQYHVASSSSFNQQVSDHLAQAIDAFFAVGGKDVETRKVVQAGVKGLLLTALDSFIRATGAGESEEKIYVVVPENNAFIRTDICIWKYHLSENALSANYDTAVAYVLCKSVIDHTKITLDELIYLVSDALASRIHVPFVEVPISFGEMPNPDKTAGKPAKIELIRNVRVLADEHHKPITSRPGSRSLPDYTPAMVDGNTLTVSAPPAINVVEAYIDEMIRVWKKLREDRGESSVHGNELQPAASTGDFRPT
jgi:hypothetical protein